MLNKKFKIKKKDEIKSFYENIFNENREGHLFNEIISSIDSLVDNRNKYKYNCEKKRTGTL